ncbi:indoleamine 2,3-dioxygenase 2 isoform X2 [Fukomys damarensis]|uniref:indoleamine 2,3-dioxygenase 2 isoform X2 n=1 Tax=Fukomys damarensis TaxID=885580 RepID=UPI0005403749|nr:indoleamine 2,3-dioxygenase 2 isoform X2 [Fukomys damarensis]
MNPPVLLDPAVQTPPLPASAQLPSPSPRHRPSGHQSWYPAGLHGCRTGTRHGEGASDESSSATVEQRCGDQRLVRKPGPENPQANECSLINTRKEKSRCSRPLEISNLETIVSLPGGESLRGFVLVTVLVEKAAVPGIKALTQATNAILQPNEDTLLKALQRLRLSIQDITRTLGQMHDYVDPDIFYAVIRIFLSGWSGNPVMPGGLVYEGASTEPLKYAGGSAAQSTVFHAFDAFLGVRHSEESADFLYRMRDYMPPSHKAFIEEIHSGPSLRDHVRAPGHARCLQAYNLCLEALVELRSYHITMVTKYLITAAARARSRGPSHLPGGPRALENRGTGVRGSTCSLLETKSSGFPDPVCPWLTVLFSQEKAILGPQRLPLG